MKLDIPFEYEVSYIKHRHRNVDRERSAGRVEVEIPEAAPGSVRLLHQIGCRPRPTEDHERPVYRFFLDGEGSRGARIVEHDGRLYVESCTLDELPERMADLARPKGHGPFHVHHRTGRTRANLASVDDRGLTGAKPVDPMELAQRVKGIRPGSYKDDSGAFVAGRLKARAAEMLVHDGSLFVPTSEPVLVVYRERCAEGGVCLEVGEARPGGWSAFASPHAEPVEDRHSEIFPLDARDDAAAYAEAVAGLAGVPFHDLGRIERVTPEALGLDGNWLLLRAATAFEFYLGNHALDNHPAVAAAIGEFREALGAEPGLCSARLLAAGDALLGRIAEHGLADFPEARPAAVLAMGGGRDVAVEAAAGLHNAGAAMLVHAASAIVRAEEAGLSWARGAAVAATPSTDGEHEASEVLSVFEAELIAGKLCDPGAIRPAAPGEALVAVGKWTRWNAAPVALVRVSDSLEVLEARGPHGRPVPPQVLALARAHASRTVRPRDPAPAEVDEADAAAFDF